MVSESFLVVPASKCAAAEDRLAGGRAAAKAPMGARWALLRQAYPKEGVPQPGPVGEVWG
ncbi:hypothetical protein VR41_06380 [Streptomyces sp. NRRL B-1568]|nr:hypothetical protein VR41_06380 [Streptomyces sp. NRRL B-1568]